VRLSDTDSPLIVAQTVGTLPPQGTSGKRWQFRSAADGLQKVALKWRAPRQPGTKVALKAKRWFTAAAADQSAGSTLLTVQVGGVCYTHPVTNKRD
jgi:hypothetical protein